MIVAAILLGISSGLSLALILACPPPSYKRRWTMIAAVIALFALVAPVEHVRDASCPTDDLHAWLVCQDVAFAAHLSGIPVRLATTLAWSESRFRRDVVSSAGAVGPLQIQPRFWCPGRSADGCDLAMAGTRALRELTGRFGLERGLCHYAAGNVCNDRALRYARFILDRADL